MEKITIADNGQWALEKNWNSKHIKSVGQWAETGLPKHLKAVPAAEGNLKSRMMSELTENAVTRMNPKTKEREFKLYRAAPENDESHLSKPTSWTAAEPFSHYWADTQQEGSKNPFKVLHGWIPEQHIHSYLAPVLKDQDHEKWGEHEVLVQPHQVNIDKTLAGESLKSAIDKSKKIHGF